MPRPSLLTRLLTIARRATHRTGTPTAGTRSSGTRSANPRTASAARRPAAPAVPRGGTTPTRPRAANPGDFDGVVHPIYEPVLDGDGDPGEIVWAWVPYEEDASRGKDRPVLVVGRDGRWLLGLMLTSKDHSGDAADEARHGRRWMDIGTGAWDAKGRASEIRLDRVLRLDPAAVRREGAILSRAVFDRVATSLGSRQGW